MVRRREPRSAFETGFGVKGIYSWLVWRLVALFMALLLFPVAVLKSIPSSAHPSLE